MAEVITRHAWILDATLRHRLDDPAIWEVFDRNIETGLSQDPDLLTDGGFWAYFHRPDELGSELSMAGFGDIALIAVEGFGWLLDDLEHRLSNPEHLLRAIRLTETEPSMLGASAHVITAATRP